MSNNVFLQTTTQAFKEHNRQKNEKNLTDELWKFTKKIWFFVDFCLKYAYSWNLHETRR